MPSIATMTDPLPTPKQPVAMRRADSEPSSGMTTPPGGRRRKRRPAPQPTFHLNIGRVDVPRSLPPTRTLGTQTAESACQEQAEVDKKLYRRALKWCNKWVMPVLRAGVAVLDFFMRRIGFGVRLN